MQDLAGTDRSQVGKTKKRIRKGSMVEKRQWALGRGEMRRRNRNEWEGKETPHLEEVSQRWASRGHNRWRPGNDRTDVN
jgi:hypothetical protein